MPQLNYRYFASLHYFEKKATIIVLIQILVLAISSFLYIKYSFYFVSFLNIFFVFISFSLTKLKIILVFISFSLTKITLTITSNILYYFKIYTITSNIANLKIYTITFNILYYFKGSFPFLVLAGRWSNCLRSCA